MKKFILSAIFILSASFSFAQMDFKRFSLTVNGGMPYFYGDITHEFGGYNFTSRFDYHITRVMSIGGEFGYGKVSGVNTSKDSEGFYFTNKYMTAFLGSEIYLFNLFKFHELSSWFQPYVGAQIGMLKNDIEDAGSEKFGPNEVHFNDWVFANKFSVGTKFKLSKFLDLNVNFSVIRVKSDEFDNHVPRYFVNNYNDLLTTTELGLTFHIGGKGKEPIIWTTPACCALPESSNNEELDSLANKVKELSGEVEETKEEVDGLADTNENLNKKLDSLQNSLNQSIADCCNNGNQGNAGGTGTEGYVYEAELEGPIEADYYIISGSYAILSNANNRIKVLEDLGYPAYIMKEPKVGLNRIVVDYTDVYSEAIEKVAKYRFDLDPKAWIVKQKK